MRRVVVDPMVCHGKACIRGTRILVSAILDCLADGMGVEAVRREYPRLTVEDIRAAIEYAAALTREEVYPLARAG